MKLIEFLLETKLYIGTIFEITAALSGIWYLKKSDYTAPEIRYFVYYLILIVFLEIYGYLPIWAWLEDYKILSFYENTVFRRNLWWGNSLKIITTLCISWIFIKQIQNEKTKKWLITILYIFPVFSILSFLTIGEFFHAYDPYVDISKTFILLICVGLYYLQILKSDEILDFFKDIRFFISVGIVIWELGMVPLGLYSGFFSLENPLYMELDRIVHQYANIFLYSVFAIGFYVDYRYNSHISKKAVM
ncbi:hypothetical protein GCM10023115_47490 [Pontixanthobacter gangjinensis]